MVAPVAYGSKMENQGIGDMPKVLIAPCYPAWNRVLFHLKHGKICAEIQTKVNVPAHDLVHAHTLFSNGYVAHRLYQKYGVPYTVTIQNTDIYTFFKKMPHLRGMGRRILRDASAVFFISLPHREETLTKYVKEADREVIRQKSHVIPLGIDKFWLENLAPPRSKPPEGMLRVGYVGEITRNKNIQALARAVELLRARGTEATLDAVGEIVDAGEVRKLSAYPFVTLHKCCPKEELIGHYRRFDLFALVSKRETFGLVCAEAMTQGLPLVYSRGQGFDKQFPDGEAGYPADCRDPQDIVNAIVRVIEQYEALSERCVSQCGRFDWDRVAAAYSEVFSGLVQKEEVK